jgi:hypothetical protein
MINPIRIASSVDFIIEIVFKIAALTMRAYCFIQNEENWVEWSMSTVQF